MTKVEKFNALVNMVAEGAAFEDGQTVAEFLAHEANITAKRNARKSNKPTKKQAENAETVEKIKALLAENGRMTATEIAKALDLSSPQKVVGIIRVAEGIDKVSDKRVTYFTLVDAE